MKYAINVQKKVVTDQYYNVIKIEDELEIIREILSRR